MAVRRAIAISVCGLVAVTGCGGHARSGAEQAAARFVADVTSKDRRAWCENTAFPLLAPARPYRPPAPAALRACAGTDLFNATGACEAEAAIFRAKVLNVRQQGDDAWARLSSGSTLQFARVRERWLFVTMDRVARKPPQSTLEAACGP